MVMLDKDDVLDQIDTVLSEYAQAYNSRRGHTAWGHDKVDEQVRYRMQAAIYRLAPQSSIYVAEANKAEDDASGPAHEAFAGILKAMRADIADDWLVSVEEIVHGETFSDFLDMATELLDKGFKDAAAVIAGSVLEGHLRALAARAGLSVDSSNGKPKKADALNADLRGADAYNVTQQKLVTAWLGLRNSAAHGKYDEYDYKLVNGLIVGIRDFLVKYSA